MYIRRASVHMQRPPIFHRSFFHFTFCEIIFLHIRNWDFRTYPLELEIIEVEASIHVSLKLPVTAPSPEIIKNKNNVSFARRGGYAVMSSGGCSRGRKKFQRNFHGGLCGALCIFIGRSSVKRDLQLEIGFMWSRL